METENKVIVVGGKGGVGKTSVSSVFIKLLVAFSKKTLVIDADPAVSLTFALGERPVKSIGDFREKLIEDPLEKKRINDIPIKDSIKNLVIKSSNNFSLMVMGRAEGPGCFCSINELLRYGIESTYKDFDVSLVDCEAGIEQVNRRAIHSIDTLLLITDTSIRGFETCVQILEIAKNYDIRKKLKPYLIINRVKKDHDKEALDNLRKRVGLDVEIVGYIPEDKNIETYNLRGKPLFQLPDDSPSVSAVNHILEKLQLI